MKVLDDNYHPVDVVEFVDNLTIPGAEPYLNFNGRVGLTRCTSDKYFGELVICYFYEEEQEKSYAEFINERDAYNMCAHRNKLDVARKLGISLIEEVEVL